MGINEDNPLMVSIYCLIYNHEPYIRQCLDGFVMQKTNFRFEAIVHDDVSTDKSADIIREYAGKYPDIIKPIFETENQYSKHDGSLDRVMNSHMKGKYIAICEGDDYWIDPFKLQKQVDFLESHLDFSMCFSNANVVAEDGIPANDGRLNLYKNLDNREYFDYEILEHWIVPTASVMYRNSIQIVQDKRFIFGDIVIFLSCAKSGRVFCFGNDTFSIYRLNKNSIISSSNLKLGSLLYVEHYRAMLGKFSKEVDKVAQKLICKSYATSLCVNKISKQSLKIMKQLLLPDIKYLCKTILCVFQNILAKIF